MFYSAVLLLANLHSDQPEHSIITLHLLNLLIVLTAQTWVCLATETVTAMPQMPLLGKLTQTDLV